MADVMIPVFGTLNNWIRATAAPETVVMIVDTITCVFFDIFFSYVKKQVAY